MPPTPQLFLITGAMAAGKSTIGEALARRLPKSVHLRGDVFRKMIVNGAAVMGPVLDEEARQQLSLRQDIAIDAARRYRHAGFSVVYQDIILGEDLTRVASRLEDLSPQIVLLVANAEILGQRDKDRRKTAYGDHFPPDILAGALDQLTPRLGLWIDTSELTVDAVVERILSAG